MGKIKPGFKSAEKERKLDAIRQGQFIRKLKRSVSHDHNYSASSKHILTPDISNVTYEEVLNPDGENITPSIEDVLKGRRVVELGVLAENLDCKVCGLPLQLKHTTNLNDFGLGSILKVMCLNQSCGHLNSVPTGGQHDRIWNVNTKVALAAMHIGIGEYQLNSLLSILNIPTVSHKMFDQRTKEIGEVLESLADKSMEHWMEKEKTLTKESTGKEEITVTVDGGWQKRGSGRAYDSLTGHCSMMGVKTGKLLGWKWRSRTCRICERAERKGEIPRVHQCRKNFTGSAKAMESDMVVELIKEAKRKGTDISTIVGDEDSTTIARVRSQVDNNIKKLSDKNHIKKPLVSKLYNLRTSHKSLTVKVINYLVKCFNYLVAQGEGQPQKISQNVKALSKHPFGDHSECSTDWCRFIESTGMKFKSLPYGKPLKDKSLQNSLTDIFDNYAKHSDKLSNLESTQANESFNKSIAAMAPKTKHYGGSGSLGYRIAATAAKKNIGNIYAVHANTSAGLSPGIYTRKLLTLRDLQARKRKAVVTTQKAKLQRIKLKSKRHQSATSLETREGISYKPGICLESDSVDLETIPAPPEIYRMNENLPAANKRNIIYFDLEATGLVIENLPMEMRERLTEMREMDLQVQNALDELDERVKSFFKKCTQPNAKQEWKDEQFEKIKKDYYKSLEDADEKVHLANHIYDLVDRHLRKLDQELSKFKMELEADNAGITEVLEKRSLELDKPPSINNHRTEKRRFLHSQPVVNNHSSEKRIATEKVLSSLAQEAAMEAIGQRKTHSNSNSPALSMFNSTSGSSLTYNLGHVGAGSNAAIAAAASQAIAATQQDFISSGVNIDSKSQTRRTDQSSRIKLQHGRRTPSMKASLMAMSDLAKELTIPKDVYSSAPSTPTASHEPKISRSKKQTSKAAQLSQVQQTTATTSLVTSTAASLLAQKQPLTPQTPATPADASPLLRDDVNSDLQIVDEHGQPVDWQNDPNEPRYCLCNQVSYGEMVGCDNDDCPIEWFHYGCVGLSQAPKGKWYCPQCTAAMKRRGRK